MTFDPDPYLKVLETYRDGVEEAFTTMGADAIAVLEKTIRDCQDPREALGVLERTLAFTSSPDVGRALASQGVGEVGLPRDDAGVVLGGKLPGRIAGVNLEYATNRAEGVYRCIGDVFHEAMEQLECSAPDLARRVGVSPSTINHYLAGRRNIDELGEPVSANAYVRTTVEKMVKAFGLSTEQRDDLLTLKRY